MNGLKLRVGASFGVIALAILCSVPAFAQGSFFSSLSGTVVDSAGLVIPGASVKVKNNGTGAEVDLVTGSDGGFLVPSIPGGNYSVIVELAGFRTTTLSSVTVSAALPASVKVVMQVGTLSESITVVGESATVVQSSSPAISTNLTGQQIQTLPLSSRNALDSLTSLAGFNTSGAARSSTVSGTTSRASCSSFGGFVGRKNRVPKGAGCLRCPPTRPKAATARPRRSSPVGRRAKAGQRVGALLRTHPLALSARGTRHLQLLGAVFTSPAGQRRPLDAAFGSGDVPRIRWHLDSSVAVAADRRGDVPPVIDELHLSAADWTNRYRI